MTPQQREYITTLDNICEGCGHCKRDGEYEKECCIMSRVRSHPCPKQVELPSCFGKYQDCPIDDECKISEQCDDKERSNDAHIAGCNILEEENRQLRKEVKKLRSSPAPATDVLGELKAELNEMGCMGDMCCREYLKTEWIPKMEELRQSRQKAPEREDAV